MPVKGRLSQLVGLSFVLFCCGLTSYAQPQQWTTVKTIPKKETEFRQALLQYRLKDYKAAFVGFEPLANSRALHQRVTASLLMTGKSLYRLERYADAIPYFDKLIDLFTQSKYVDDAYYAKALCNYRLGNLSAAVTNALQAADWSSDAVLVSRSKRLANLVLRSDLSLSAMRRLLRAATGEHSSALVTIALARKELSEGSREKAISLLRAYKRKYNSKQYLPQIDQLLNEAEGSEGRPLKVGVILPLTGYYAEEGRGVLRGIQFAQTHGANDHAPIELEIWDSESNMVKAIHGVNKLVRRDHVHVIVGELESEITAGIGALSSLKKVPLIGPTATENQVSTVGKWVFQLNSSLEIKGAVLAEYAFNSLGLRTFATLAPADEYGQEMTNSFTSKIDQLGGRIIAQSWYYADSEDLNLSRQFKNIRAASFAFDSTDVESLIEEAKAKGDELEEKDIPVHSVDGIFFPVYSEDIPYIAPQFALSNIRAQVLGGEYWDALEILKAPQVEPYINGAIFVSDYFPDESSRHFRNFRNDFRLKMKTTPERWEAFGYDALNILKEVVKSGGISRQAINRNLSALSGYKGIKGNISFKGNNRVNSEVNLLQFINGRIVKHQGLEN